MDNTNNIHELLKKRQSPRAFSEKKVDDAKILSLLEAARWAPSSMNEQPWRFIIAKKENGEDFNNMLDILNPSNRLWAKSSSLLILTIAKLDSDYSKKPNRHAFYDLGNSVAQFTFQATAMDVYVRQMGGFNIDLARQRFLIPENYSPVSVLAVGYKGNPLDLPEELRIKENAARIRKNIGEFAFNGKFGVALFNDNNIGELKKAG